MLEELRDVGYSKFFIVDQRIAKDFRFDFNKQYDWVEYDEARELFSTLKEQDFEYGVWADIYASI